MKMCPTALILQQMHSGPTWKAYPAKFQKDLLNIIENKFVCTTEICLGIRTNYAGVNESW